MENRGLHNGNCRALLRPSLLGIEMDGGRCRVKRLLWRSIVSLDEFRRWQIEIDIQTTQPDKKETLRFEGRSEVVDELRSTLS